ncbi:MAG: teichoic acid transport system permease protein [Candidatus Aldehydirespiratoraceae bacterium]|jgi:teichoic acid transport system permease protein
MSNATHEANDELFSASRVEPLGTYLRSLWDRRDYIIQVPLNELRVQQANTLLGNVWLLLNPVLQVGVYFLVFGLIVDVRRGIDDYIVFLTIGVFVFFFSQRVITNCASSIQTSIGLIRAMRFPRAVLPLGNVVFAVLAFVPTFFVMILVTVGYGNLPTWRWLAVVPIFILQISFSAGAGFFVARLNHLYADLENTLPFIFRLLFYMSGVLYAVDRFIENESLRQLFAINPMYDFLSLWRWALLDLEVMGVVWFASVLWAFVALIFGFLFFRAGEGSYGRGS